MSELLKKINGFDRLKRQIFLESIYSDHKQFLIILKTADEKARNEFLSPLPEGGVKWWQNQINELGNIENSELEAAETKIADAMKNLDEKVAQMEENTQKAQEKILEYRQIMKADFLGLSAVISDQSRGLPIPPIQKSYDDDANIIDLPKPDKSIVKKKGIFDCIGERESRRKFTQENLTLAELSYLLWATQGVRKSIRNNTVTFRTVASGGSRHPFETYIAVNHVEGLEPGVYNYLPLEHKLAYLFTTDNQKEKLAQAALGQKFVGDCAVCFIWSTIPYRCEWRYTLESKKIILQDSGHLCQNLYLAVESIQCGTCGIGAYNQQLFDDFLKLDGKDEFVVYVAPVGKLEN